MEFHLPAHRLEAPALNALLHRFGYDVPPLHFSELRGFFKGFIDLVFEHQGRFFILDWKSNHLGNQPADYGHGPLATAMAEQGYHLQSLLYAVALDRYLRLRLPGYEPETHFGGVLYLFVRGVRPQSLTDDGRPTGLHFHRPRKEVIASLSSLFDADQVPE
jgi:exodeoxyribonuclease V beta subunit